MSNYLKELKTKLQKMEEGYPHQWKLIKETYIPEPKEEINHSLEFYDKITRQTTKPLCQNIDLIVPSENRTQSQQIQLEQFLNIIGTKLDKQRSFIQETQEPIQDTLITKKFIRNDEKRHFRIQEFIKTERSYVDTLQTIVKHVVRPLRANMNQKTAILNTFKCQKIFLNIDQIAIVNKDFLADLDSMNDNFGELCSKHIIKFECYRKYLLEQAEAQKLHAKEFKVNQNYRRFLVKVKDHADFKRKRLQDILVEPVQRISRYSMMLRDILQLTPEDHHDYQGLKAACEKAREIATMADDDPTKTATMFLNLYQSIKDSPCSLINQKRSFIAHLDAIEIHRVTNKPTRAVTIFLFTDKILVASRSSIDAKGIDIQQILEYSNPMSPTSLFSGNNKDNRADKHQLRFKGWADIESIEMFEGVPERPGSFILSATNIPEIHRDEMSNLTSFEKYFYKGPRLYSVIPQKDEMSSRLKRTEYVEKSVEFRTVYQKTRALMKQYDVPENKVYHKLWKGTFTFCNIYYSQESYLDAKYKNDFALIYVDNDQIQLETLFPSQSSLYHPWVIGLVQPEEMKGFRFNICSKLRFSSSTTHTDPTIDFESIFWNNLLYLNQCLKQSNEYLTQTIVKVQQSVLNNSQQQQRSRSKSISRTSSIPSIGKLFHSNGSTSRSRSVSPSKMIKKSKSASYSATSNRASVHYASWSEQYYKSESQASSLATLNSSLSSSSGHLPQDTEYTYDQKELPLDIQLNMLHLPSTTKDPRKSFYMNSVESNRHVNTISSLGSDSSAGSSFSIIEDLNDDVHDDRQGETDFMTLNVISKTATSPLKFEDEMQQQWKALAHKYEL